MYLQQSTALYQDYVCRKGFTDARSYFAHIVAQQKLNSHLDQLFRHFDPSQFNIRYVPPHISNRPKQRAVALPLCKDVLRSSISYPAPKTTYNLAKVDLARLTTDDLVILWGNGIRAMQMSVQYPVACAGHVSGSILSRQVVAWKVIEIPSHAAPLPDPNMCLFPSLAAAYHDDSPDQLPPLDELKQLYLKRTHRKIHLIFIFRHSRGATKDHEQTHMREALATASYINASGTVEVVSFSMICARNLRGCWIPSFANDIETELAFVAQSIVAARRSSKVVRMSTA